MTAPAEHGDAPDLTEQEREVAQVACRALHPTRWEYAALSHPCDDCGVVARAVAAADLSARSAATPGPSMASAEAQNTLTGLLAPHRPVVDPQGRVVGCQCMDRVFVRNAEDYPSHLAEVVGTGFVDTILALWRVDMVAAQAATPDTAALEHYERGVTDLLATAEQDRFPQPRHVPLREDNGYVSFTTLRLRARDLLDPGTRDQADQGTRHADQPGRCGDPTCDEEHP